MLQLIVTPQGIEKVTIQLTDTPTKVYAIGARLFFLSKVPLEVLQNWVLNQLLVTLWCRKSAPFAHIIITFNMYKIIPIFLHSITRENNNIDKMLCIKTLLKCFHIFVVVQASRFGAFSCGSSIQF